MAANKQNEKLIDILIKNGADIDRNLDDGKVALHMVTKNNDKKSLEILIKHGANVNVKDSKGCTPLHYAT